MLTMRLWMDLGRSAVLRQQLLTTLEVLGLEVGDSMEAEDLGLYVKVASMTRNRFTTESLEGAGVPAELIEKATLTSHSRPHLRIAPLKDKGRQNAKSGQLSRWRGD